MPNQEREERLIAHHSAEMAKIRLRAKKAGKNFWELKSFQEHKRLVGVHHAKLRHRRRDTHHKTTRFLVDNYDTIVVEDLDLVRLTRKKKGEGAEAQSRLNHSMRDAALGILGRVLEYKVRLADRTLVKVDPSYTSQRCSACGHIAVGNRDSQAVFKCIMCSYEDNADTNGAKNILARYTTGWASPKTSGRGALKASLPEV